MDISIIIPIFNKKELTIQCLQSLKATCSTENVEVIVVDNASSDGSSEDVKEWSEQNNFPVNLIQNKENEGFSRANNQAALVAKGEILICLNNDTIAEKGWLEALIAPLKRDPKIAMVGAKLVFPDRTIQHAGVSFMQGLPVHDYVKQPENDQKASVSGQRIAVTAACMAMRKKDFLQFGGFDEAYRNGYEDVDLCIRLHIAGYKIWYEANAKLVHLESQSPGRKVGGFENAVILFNRWAPVLTTADFRDVPVTGQRFIPGRSIISEYKNLDGDVPGEASESERYALLRLFAANFPADIAARMIPFLLENPENHPGYAFLKALMENKKGNIPAARLALIDHLRRFPNDREAELRLAEIFVRENQSPKAIQILERILRKEPANVQIAQTLKKIRAIGGHLEKTFVFQSSFHEASHLTSEKPDFSIVMLTHNQWHHTEKCLQSIELYSDRPYELILVDNASTDGTVENLTKYVARHKNHKLIKNSQNLGFPKGNNQGFSIAKGKTIVWLNNDTVVTPNWMSRMDEVFEKNPEIALLGPVTNHVVGPQLIADVPYFDKDSLEKFANDRFHQFGFKTTPLHRIIGYCLVKKRGVLQTIGGLDETFGRGNFEDDDYCVRARQAGFGIAMAPGLFIHHTGNQTFRAVSTDYKQLLDTNFNYFCQKWGIPPKKELSGYRFDEISTNRSGEKVPLPNLLETHQLDNSGKVYSEK